MFTSACTSRNALFVVELEISGTRILALSWNRPLYTFTRLLVGPATPTEHIPKYAFERPTNVQESVQFHFDTLNIPRISI